LSSPEEPATPKEPPRPPQVTLVTGEFVPPPEAPALEPRRGKDLFAKPASKDMHVAVTEPGVAEEAPFVSRMPESVSSEAPAADVYRSARDSASRGSALRGSATTKSSSRGSSTGSGAFVSFAPGTFLGPWCIERELGRGGMGIVFAARAPNGSLAALKVLRDPTRGRLVQRFVRETHALGRLDHPNIVRLLDYGEESAQPYYVMDFVTGKSFEDALKDSAMPLRQRIKIMSEIARGVAHAHGKGVIHRDLKPQNVILDEAGVPKVTDFGLARITDDEDQGGTKVTLAGAAIGTPGYMSPEQFRGRRTDARTDVYALGVMLYECVQRRLPFEVTKDLHQLGIDVVEKAPPPPSTDPMLSATILRALEKDPANRHPTALELARDLEAWLAGEREAPAVRRDARSSSRRLAVPAADAATPKARVAAAPQASAAAKRSSPMPIVLLVVALAGAAAGGAIYLLPRAAPLEPLAAAPPPAPPPVEAKPAAPPPIEAPPPPKPADPPAAAPAAPAPSAAPPGPVAPLTPSVEVGEGLWVDVASDLGFTVSMPEPPGSSHRDSLRATTKRGNSLHLERHVTSLELAKGGSYAASAIVLPPGSGTPAEILAMVARGLADEAHWKQADWKPLHAPLQGGELSGSLEGTGTTAHMRFFVSGLRVFVLTATVSDERGLDAAARRFLGSFKLGG
jgi:serine/threonine-protein kinase